MVVPEVAQNTILLYLSKLTARYDGVTARRRAEDIVTPAQNPDHSADEAPAASRSDDRFVRIRTRSSWWIWGFLAILTVFFLGDAVVRGAWGFVLLALPWMALVLWGTWVVLVRPSVTVRPDRLVVHNMFRVHDIPWAAVARLTDRFQLVVELTDGRNLVSWGAPTGGLGKASVSGDAAGVTIVRDNAEAPRDGRRTMADRRGRSASTPTTQSVVDKVRRAWNTSTSKKVSPSSSPGQAASPGQAVPQAHVDGLAVGVSVAIVIWCAITAGVSTLL